MGKEFYTAVVAYTTPSGRMHLGHGLGHTMADVTMRYNSLKSGKKGFFPIGVHATGKDLVKIIDKLSSEGDKTAIYERYNISQKKAKEILAFPQLEERVDSLVMEYKNQYQEVLEKLGIGIDIDAFFSSHQSANQKFTQWTLRKLNKSNLIVDSKNPRYFCTKCEDIKAIESDFSEVSPSGKVDLDNLNIAEGSYILFEGDKAIIPVYTTRPETVFGATNIYGNNNISYVAVDLKNKDKPVIVDEESLDQLIDTLGGKSSVKNILSTKNITSEIITNPVNNQKIPILNANFVKANNGTGFVMSVPSHDPFDAFYLKKVAPELLDNKKVVIVDKNGNPISFDIEELTEKNLEEIRKNTYKLQEKGFFANDIEKYSNMSVKVGRKKLLENLISQGLGGELLRLEGGVFNCRADDTRIIAKRTSERAINYANQEVQNKVISLIDNMIINPGNYREELKGFIRTRLPKPCERKGENMVGSPSPFDSTKRIEALADSNIYMEFYGIAQLINQGKIKEDNLTDEFFNYVFLNEGIIEEVSQNVGLSTKKLEIVKKHINEIYPINLNVAATEHKDVHFPFSLFTHGAVLPDSFFPEEYLLTSLITMKGEKMSKSKGNVIYLDNLIEDIRTNHPIEGFSEEVSFDAIRYFLTNYQSLDRNFDWDPDVFENSGIGALQKFVTNKNRQIQILKEESTIPKTKKSSSLDKWLLTTKQKAIQNVNESMDKRDFRKSSIEVFTMMEKALRHYQTHAKYRDLNLESDFLKTQIEMTYPFTPRVAQELYKRGFDSEINSWPEMNSKEKFAEDFEQIESTFNPNHKKLRIGKVQAELGKMMGKKEITKGDNVTIIVPADFTKEMIENSNMKQLKTLNVSFEVNPNIDEIEIRKN
ncbi:MAG: class I tRNA ligase family protein [Candidatus Woesearchaeota archaeon]|jgi:leucyl-tRNA synthetase|nr:class I tRNA ligase family protein [Candidatus Woesearchaeota archaeon]